MVNQEVGEDLGWVGKLGWFCREINGCDFQNENGRDRKVDEMKNSENGRE